MKNLTKFIALLIFMTISAHILAQEAEADKIGDITVYPVLHGSLVLTWNEEVIYIDPYGGAELYMDFPPPTMVMITDIHGDHLHKPTLDSLPLANSTLVVPKAVADQLGTLAAEKIEIILNGETGSYREIMVEAVPMYNLPETEDSRHPKGRGNGYVLQLGDQRVYISGDTEDIPEMRRLTGIDIAFVCMNLPFTMTVEQAASAVNEFKPGIVYPYHYRGRPDISDVEEFKNLVEKENKETEVRLRNWYPEK